MRSWLLALSFMLVICPALSAHPPAQQIKAGHWDVSWYLHPTTSVMEYTALSFTDSSCATVKQADYFPMTNEYSPSCGGGTITMAEYGITDRLSVGARANVMDVFLHGFRDGYWLFCPTTYATYNALSLDRYKLTLQEEFQVFPLYSLPKQSRSGLGAYNNYFTLSNDFLLGRNQNYSLNAYCDLKDIITIVNQDYQSDEFYKLYKTGYAADGTYTKEEISDFVHVFHPMSRVAAAFGLDLAWDKFQVNLGLNIPIVDFSFDGKYSKSYLADFSFLSEIQLPNIELTWRARL